MVNINGEVIGVTSLKLVQDEIDGMGFAIPIEMVKNILDDFQEKNVTDWSTLKSGMRDGLREFLYEKTKRKPMILPIIMEV